MKVLLLLLFCGTAWGQSYTVYKLATAPTLPPSNFAEHSWSSPMYLGNPPVLGTVATAITYTNGSIYVGNFAEYSLRTTAAIWFKGPNQPGTDLTVLADAPYLTEADSVDTNGNIIADDFIFDRTIPPNQPQATPNYYLLIPTVNPLAAQVKMWQGASAWYEAHWLAWMAKAAECQKNGGRC